jgi:hypothetical protein
MPGDSGEPVVTMLVWFQFFPTRGCGCGGHLAFPTPSVGREALAKLGRIALRDRFVMPGFDPGMTIFEITGSSPLMTTEERGPGC